MGSKMTGQCLAPATNPQTHRSSTRHESRSPSWVAGLTPTNGAAKDPGGEPDIDEGPESGSDTEPSVAVLRAENMTRRWAHTPGEGGAPQSYVPGRPSALCGSGLRRGGSHQPRGCQPRLLADERSLLPAARAKMLAEFVGVTDCRLVNSGSSANLSAFSTLTSPRLGNRRMRPGDELITVAAGFPTTVAPAIQHGVVPVFVDVDPLTDNIDTSMLSQALSARTKAVMVAHTLGNPFDIDSVLDFCESNGLWLIEDNCDAMGSEYTTQRGGVSETRRTGTFGHLATSSFYPAHQMTTGEGGAVYTSDEELASIAESIRDWGRDCYCQPGRSNTCGKRFGWSLGTLPEGYDHKYTYSHFGYNLKMTDMQAAVGVAQLKKLPSFVAARRQNFEYLHKRLEPLSDVLRLPEATAASDTQLVRIPGRSEARNFGHQGYGRRSPREGTCPDQDALCRESGPPTLFRRDAVDR